MADNIFIEGLTLKTIIGVNPWEREVPQTLVLDAHCDCNLEEAAKTDDVAYALNYDVLKRTIEAFATASNYQLLESFAQHLMNTLFETFDGSQGAAIQGIRLRVNKPGALSGVKTVGLEMHRKR